MTDQADTIGAQKVLHEAGGDCLSDVPPPPKADACYKQGCRHTVACKASVAAYKRDYRLRLTTEIAAARMVDVWPSLCRFHAGCDATGGGWRRCGGVWHRAREPQTTVADLLGISR